MALLLLIWHKFLPLSNYMKLRVKEALGWNRVPTKLHENRSGTSSVAMETHLEESVPITLVASARNVNVQKVDATEQPRLTQTFVNIWRLFSMCVVILRDKLCGWIVKNLASYSRVRFSWQISLMYVTEENHGKKAVTVFFQILTYRHIMTPGSLLLLCRR